MDTLTAGRELDIRIAELRTGQSRLTCRIDPVNRGGEPQFHFGYPHGHDFAPNYSTDDLIVLRELDLMDFDMIMFRKQNSKWSCGIKKSATTGSRGLSLRTSYHSTMALAACDLIIEYYERIRND